jgi:hypothetical protein
MGRYAQQAMACCGALSLLGRLMLATVQRYDRATAPRQKAGRTYVGRIPMRVSVRLLAGKDQREDRSAPKWHTAQGQESRLRSRTDHDRVLSSISRASSARDRRVVPRPRPGGVRLPPTPGRGRSGRACGTARHYRLRRGGCDAQRSTSDAFVTLDRASTRARKSGSRRT